VYLESADLMSSLNDKLNEINSSI